MMIRPFRPFLPLLCSALGFILQAQPAFAAPSGAGFDFPVYTNKPLGRQLSGQHAPASTPALAPDQAQAKFTLPAGYEIRLFAAEPAVVNPVAMTWDSRGRLWVVELYEYPLGATAGERPRDRIKILEDMDADGRADKVHVWADGLNLATGILLGDGGAYVGQAPHLLHLRDTDGDDRADRRDVVLTGFGLEDRHELLNGFTWGPDGQLYMTHGVFTRSRVKDPNRPDDDGVLMTAAVARVDTRTKRFEVFAEGTSNPWGVDFDRYGNAFVSACVIEHLFHMAPGGIYDRQAGSPPHPYAYERLKAINDHKHHMAAYAGVQVYQGDQYPEAMRGSILMGNIHDNAVHQDALQPNGSSFTASFERDFVRANDGWFMPVSTQVGPDGCVWIMDWYDRYPCYQNANADPEGIDREHGRIWRVVHVGPQPGKAVPSRPARDMNLAGLSTGALVALLEHRNVWQRRQAQRLLQERRDESGKAGLLGLLRRGPTLEARLGALWSLHGAGLLDDAILIETTKAAEPALRAWVARLTGERVHSYEEPPAQLLRLATDPSPVVQLAVATAVRQFYSGSLTINTPPAQPDMELDEVLMGLVGASAKAPDPLVAYMIWHASEPRFAANPAPGLNWLAENGGSILPLAASLAGKAMRRLCDMRDRQRLDLALEFVERVADPVPALAVSALEGLLRGMEGKALLPGMPAGPWLQKLSRHPDRRIGELAQRLGALWGDAAALNAVLARILEDSAAESARIAAIQTARKSNSDAARETLLRLLAGSATSTLQTEAVGALGELGGDGVGSALVGTWKQLSAPARRAAAETLNSRGQWKPALFTGLENGTISASDLSTSLVRSMVNSKDEFTRLRAAKVIGRFREPDADKGKIIADKRRLVLAGAADLAAGREVARRTCLTCHRLHGEGAEVGPDLTGVGRSSLDALLANIIDPNQIIGAGYENVEVETKDGRTVSGRLVENTDARVRLVAAGPKEDTIARSDIAHLRVLEMSVMPEGLEVMADADFRNMIWFLLAPPEEGPLTPEKRRALTGQDKPSAAVAPPRLRDAEAVALWNPEWRVVAPETETSPARLADVAGRQAVLRTHPFDGKRPARLKRRADLPAGRRALLRFAAAADRGGAWQVRVFVSTDPGKETLVHRALIEGGEKGHGDGGVQWQEFSIDLGRWAGSTVGLRVEQHAVDDRDAGGYWADLRVQSLDLAAER